MSPDALTRRRAAELRPPSRLTPPPGQQDGSWWTPGRRLALLGALTLAAIAFFLAYGIQGSWEFALSLRTMTVLTMLLVGYAIAVSTVLFQTITHNRILTPSIMGFDALYVLIQTVLVAVLGIRGAVGLSEPVQFAAEVTIMVVASTLLYRWLFLSGQRPLHLLVLVGVVLGVLFRSLSNFVQRLMDPNAFAVLQDRFFASFTAVDQPLLLASAVTVLIASAMAWRLFHTFDVLALGRDTAVNLGVEHRKVVMATLVLVAVLVSVSTALVGPVTFFGLLVANLAYQVMGTSRHQWTLPAAVLLSVSALVGGQAVLQHVFALDTSLSIIIEFLGGIVFIVLLVRGSKT